MPFSTGNSRNISGSQNYIRITSNNATIQKSNSRLYGNISLISSTQLLFIWTAKVPSTNSRPPHTWGIAMKGEWGVIRDSCLNQFQLKYFTFWNFTKIYDQVKDIDGAPPRASEKSCAGKDPWSLSFIKFTICPCREAHRIKMLKQRNTSEIPSRTPLRQTWGNWGPRRLYDFPRITITHGLSNRAGTRLLTPSQVFFL